MTGSSILKSGGPACPEAALRSTASEAVFVQAQAGCRYCLDHLMATHEALVHAVVRRQTTLGPLSYVEAVQAGRLGLWNAILHFDPQRGQAFSTYAWPSIMHRVWNEVKMTRRRERRTHHPETYDRLALRPPLEDDWLALRHDILVRLALRRLLARLPQRLGQVLTAYYGLDDWPPASFRQIGATMGLSHEGVRRLHTEALVWLRHPAHSQELRVLLGRHSLADYEAAADQAQLWRQKRGHRRGRSL